MSGYENLKKSVLDKNLCTMCGTCIGVCPIQTIAFQGEKIINPSQNCINCGKCLKCCPGSEFDFAKFNKDIYGIEYNEKHDMLGNYTDIYCGYSSDEMIRKQAASGGIISTILLELLKTKQVDGVVIIDSSSIENPLQYKAKIVSTPEEILGASQSKYKIIPTNVIVNELMKLDGKYAYVGLPCQIQGLRKAMSEEPRLRDRIHVTIGLFCGLNLSDKATDYLLNKGKIKKELVTDISYRKKMNNKTGFYANDKGGKEFFISKHGYTFLNLIYSPKRCWMCYDYASEFADISVGDAWEQGEGWSRIIVRSEIGKTIISSVSRENKIFLKISSSEDIYNSQKAILNYKKSGYWFRISKLKYSPDNNIYKYKKEEKSNIKHYIMFIIQLFGQTKICRGLLKLIPIRALEKISTKLRK